MSDITNNEQLEQITDLRVRLARAESSVFSRTRCGKLWVSCVTKRDWAAKPRRVIAELSEIRSLDVVLSTRSSPEVRTRCISKPTHHHANDDDQRTRASNVISPRSWPLSSRSRLNVRIELPSPLSSTMTSPGCSPSIFAVPAT